MQYIVHISDIHIKPDSYRNLRHAFSRLIADICRLIASGHRVVLVVAGDIFENKTNMNTDDIHVFYEFVDQLESAKIQTIIIPGNHDYNVNSAFSSDNIQILMRKFQFVKCISNTTELVIDGVSYGIFSPIDKGIPKITPGLTNVAILHEPVNAAKFDNGDVISGARFSPDNLIDWDIVLLGDIHLPQFLKTNMAYSGSLVQKNRGEGLNHGYILWDVSARTGKHVFIPVLEVYLKIIAHDDTCELPTLSPEQTVRFISLHHSGCSDTYITGLVEEITSKYSCGVNKIINRTESSVMIAETPRQPRVDITKILVELLEGRKLEQEVKDRILDYHNKTLQDRKHKIATTYQINYLVWSNVMCYGPDNFIDFRTLHRKLVVIDGKNKMGKSSILDILVRVLFNSNYRGQMCDMVNKDATVGSIKVSVQVSQDEYIIEQHINRKMNKTEHRVYRNGVNVTRSCLTETYAFLANEVGLGQYDNFINITAALQQRAYLVDMSRDNLMKLFIKILDIDTLAEIESAVYKQITKLTSDLKLVNSEILQHQNEKIGDVGDQDDSDDGMKRVEKLNDRRKHLVTELARINSQLTASREEELLLSKQWQKIEQPDASFNPSQAPPIPNKPEPTQATLNQLHKLEGQYSSKLQSLAVPAPGVKACALSSEVYSQTREEYVRLSKVTKVTKAAKESKLTAAEILEEKQKCAPYLSAQKKTAAQLYKNLIRSAPDQPHPNIPELSDTEFTEQFSKEFMELQRQDVQPCKPPNTNREDVEAIACKLSDEVLASVDLAGDFAPPPEDLDKLKEYETLLSTTLNISLSDRKEKQDALISLRAKLANYQSNYGGLQFDRGCRSCIHNSTKLEATHNAKDLETKIARLVRELDLQEERVRVQQRLQVLKQYKQRNLSVVREALSQHNASEHLCGDDDIVNLVKQVRMAKEELLKHDRADRYARYLYLRKCQDNISWRKNQEILKQIDEVEQHNADIDAHIQRYAEMCNLVNIQRLSHLGSLLDMHGAFAYQAMKNKLDQVTEELKSTVELQQQWELRKTYEQQASLHKQWDQNMVIESRLASIRKEILSLEQILKESTTEHVRVAQQVELCLANLRTIKRLDDKRKDLEFHKKWLSEYHSLIEHKKGIPAMILRNTAVVLEDKINDILSRIAEFKVHITMDHKSQFHIYTVDGTTEIPASMASGYQKFLLDIIMRIVFTSVSVLSNPETLFIDEGFGCLDQENFSEISKVLIKLKEGFTMFIITHLSELKSYSDAALSVTKDSKTRLSELRFGNLSKAECSFLTNAELNKLFSATREHKAKVDSRLTVPADLHEDLDQYTDILTEVRGVKFYCRACKAEYQYRKGAIQRHLASSRAKGQHLAFIGAEKIEK